MNSDFFMQKAIELSIKNIHNNGGHFGCVIVKNNKLIFTLEDRFCRFDKYESVNKKWNNKIRKFQEWDPKHKEIKQKDDKIKYEGEWITPKLLSKDGIN